MGSDRISGMTPAMVREIQHEKGAAFTAKFVRDFDRDWKEVMMAARKLKERRKRRTNNAVKNK